MGESLYFWRMDFTFEETNIKRTGNIYENFYNYSYLQCGGRSRGKMVYKLCSHTYLDTFSMKIIRKEGSKQKLFRKRWKWGRILGSLTCEISLEKNYSSLTCGSRREAVRSNSLDDQNCSVLTSSEEDLYQGRWLPSFIEKLFYLVPLRSLAEEKYRHFKTHRYVE